MGDRLRAGIPSCYLTSQLGQLSLASFGGCLIEYQLWLGKRLQCHLCRVAGNTVAVRQVRLRTAMSIYFTLLYICMNTIFYSVERPELHLLLWHCWSGIKNGMLTFVTLCEYDKHDN